LIILLPSQLDLPTFLNSILPLRKQKNSRQVIELAKTPIQTSHRQFSDSTIILLDPIIKVILQKHRLENSDSTVRAIRKLALLTQCARNLKARFINFELKPGLEPDAVDEWLSILQSECQSNILAYTNDTLDAMYQWLSEVEQKTG